MTNSTRIPNGSLVRLDDGTTATAYYDTDGTYRTVQMNLVTRGDRVDYGWRREQLTEIVCGGLCEPMCKQCNEMADEAADRRGW